MTSDSFGKENLCVTSLVERDRERWAELWSQNLAFYGIEKPRDVFDSTWSCLFEPEGCIRGLGVRDESHQGFLVDISHYVLHDNTWTTTQGLLPSESLCRSGMAPSGAYREVLFSALLTRRVFTDARHSFS